MAGSIATMDRLFVLAAKSSIGYDQWERWSYLDKERKELKPNSETDCSALSLGIAWLAGYAINIEGTAYTGNFVELCKAAGFVPISVKGWDQAKLYSAIRKGDFLLGPGHVLYVYTPTQWITADGDEKGNAYGGQAGDQTGNEVRIRTPYMRSAGWEYIVRPPDSGKVAVELSVVKPIVPGWTHRVGEWVNALNVRTAPTSDGSLGKVVASVKPGARLVILNVPGKKDRLNAWWRQVKFEGGTVGWINVNYIRPI